ncbi:MAG: DUF421 domain-containing protein [Dehalococcoidia bacterium]|nr:DUF421 domain-containing protein [Dehalococcoidia bacterium]
MWPETWGATIEIVGRTVAVFAVVLAGFRLMGKRELGQMTPFDLVLILLIANAVQNAMVGPDNSLAGGLLSAIVLLAANAVTARVRAMSPRAERLLEGQPALLVHDGKFVQENLHHEGISEDEILMAMREHGIDDPAEVKLAVLEVDGSISIVPKDSKVLRTRRKIRQMKHG